MSVVTGSVMDTGYQSMYPEAVQLVWTLNQPITTSTGYVVPSRPQIITPEMNGSFSFTTLSTDLMDQDAFFTLAIRSLAKDAPNGQGFIDVDFPQWQIKVPEGEWNLSTLIRTAAGGGNPTAWFFQPTEPDPFPIGSYWVNSTTGDIYQRVG